MRQRQRGCGYCSYLWGTHLHFELAAKSFYLSSLKWGKHGRRMPMNHKASQLEFSTSMAALFIIFLHIFSHQSGSFLGKQHTLATFLLHFHCIFIFQALSLLLRALEILNFRLVHGLNRLGPQYLNSHWVDFHAIWVFYWIIIWRRLHSIMQCFVWAHIPVELSQG